MDEAAARIEWGRQDARRASLDLVERKMTSVHYFDDPESGLSPQTSHPRFVELAPDAFFYDVCDDFSPFGSDDGNDTLAFLEDWYRDGGKDNEILLFLEDFLDSWDLPVPDEMLSADKATLEKWLAEDRMNERYLGAECRATVAAAFGQLKIAGRAEPAIRDEALAALQCQMRLNEYNRTHTPTWKFAGLERERLVRMETVLKQL